MIFGLVLAGGRSSRFGTEKAVADIGGLPMIGRVTAVLARGCDRIAVSARAGSAAAEFAARRGLPVLQDDPADAPGPLAGIKAGLSWAAAVGSGCLLTVPCDTPLLPCDLVARLASALSPDASAVVVRTADGVQPLCALWRVARLDAVQEALTSAHHPPVQTLLSQLGASEVAFDEQAFLNVNTREDQVRAAALT